MVFINDELVNKQGGAREFEAWAETEANWNNFRSETLYKALAEESYKAHLNSKNVSTNRSNMIDKIATYYYTCKNPNKIC